MNVMFRILGNM